jgi:hypothetical protein
MFDARGFLESEFGNARKVLALFDAYGLDAPPLDTVKKWYTRGSVSGAWLAVLVGILEIEKQQAISLAAYTNGGKRRDSRCRPV